jgi:hypothetical protein
MTLNITGNNTLFELDDEYWLVTKITNRTIKVKTNGQDTVAFERMQWDCYTANGQDGNILPLLFRHRSGFEHSNLRIWGYSI